MGDKQKSLILDLLKADLEKLNPPKSQIQYLETLIDVSHNAIVKEGIVLNLDNPLHRSCVEMYAAWLYRKRTHDGDQSRMPRMLRWQLNQLLFGKKDDSNG